VNGTKFDALDTSLCLRNFTVYTARCVRMAGDYITHYATAEASYDRARSLTLYL